MRKTKDSGDIGETLAENILKEKGYTIVEKNFRSRFGEIDIVAKDGDELVFVEVKTRWSNRYGKPEEAVTAKKLSRIKRTIDYYLLINKVKMKYRLEVVAIQIENNEVKSVKIIPVVA